MDPDRVTTEALANQDVIEVNTGCARCGGFHEGLKMKRFENPVYIKCPEDGYTVTDTHWATCPKTGDPLLARWEDTEEE